MVHLLKVLNGAAIVPAVVLLGVLVLYLCRESLRRGLRPFDWLHLPPSMNLALAVLILVAFLSLRLATTWIWYLIGEKLIPLQAMFIVAILGIIVGLLCIVRAITEPDYGKMPWMLSIALVLFVAILLT